MPVRSDIPLTPDDILCLQSGARLQEMTMQKEMHLIAYDVCGDCKGLSCSRLVMDFTMGDGIHNAGAIFQSSNLSKVSFLGTNVRAANVKQTKCQVYFTIP